MKDRMKNRKQLNYIQMFSTHDKPIISDIPFVYSSWHVTPEKSKNHKMWTGAAAICCHTSDGIIVSKYVLSTMAKTSVLNLKSI